MKPVLFFILLSISLIACQNSDKDTDTASLSSDEISVTDSIPRVIFKDSSLNNYALEYESFVNNYIKALQNEDKKMLETLKEQSLALADSARMLSQKINSPAEIAAYDEWIAMQDDKIKSFQDSIH